MEHLMNNWLVVLVFMLVITIILMAYNHDKRVKTLKKTISYSADLTRRFNKANLEYIEEIKNLETSNLLLVKEVRDKTDRIKNLLECIVFLTDKAEIKEEVIKASSPDIAAELSKVLKKK